MLWQEKILCINSRLHGYLSVSERTRAVLLALKQNYNSLNGGDNEQQNFTSQVAINVLFPSKTLGNESDFTLHVFSNVFRDKVIECPLPSLKIDIFLQNALWSYKQHQTRKNQDHIACIKCPQTSHFFLLSRMQQCKQRTAGYIEAFVHFSISVLPEVLDKSNAYK